MRGPRALPRRRARRAPGVDAPPGGAGSGHVARVWRLLRQGLRRHLGAGGDAEEDHRPGPVRHPGHRRGKRQILTQSQSIFMMCPNDYGPYIDNDLMVRMMHHLIIQEKVMSLQKCSIPPQFELVRCTNFFKIQTYLILTKFVE